MLQHLDISGCDAHVTDLGLSKLAILRNLRHLNVAFLDRTGKFFGTSRALRAWLSSGVPKYIFELKHHPQSYRTSIVTGLLLSCALLRHFCTLIGRGPPVILGTCRPPYFGLKLLDLEHSCTLGLQPSFGLGVCWVT